MKMHIIGNITTDKMIKMTTIPVIIANAEEIGALLDTYFIFNYWTEQIKWLYQI